MAEGVSRMFRQQVLAASLVLLGGCSQLPAAAPTSREFAAAAPRARLQFLVVDLDAAAARLMTQVAVEPSSSWQVGSYTPRLQLHPGDTVGVTLFDFGAVPLFSGNGQSSASDVGAGAVSGGGHGTALPPQTVEADGSIAIPFAGRIRVAGLTPVAAGDHIVAALAGRAATPQAVVSLLGTSLDTATVGGDVVRPALVPLTLRGERILDAVAAAGGARYEPYDCDVQLTRHDMIQRTAMQRIVDDPGANLVLEPGDTLFVLHAPRSFLVLGAASKVAQYDFGTQQVTLAEAVARGGGPNEAVADLGKLYLLRNEPPGVLRHLLALGAGGLAQVAPQTPLPVAYRLDLRHGDGYFLAQQIPMRDKDVILMTNANEVELQKIFGVVRDVTGVYYDLHSRF